MGPMAMPSQRTSLPGNRPFMQRSSETWGTLSFSHRLLSHLMDEEQLERHMASRRGTLNKGSVRKVCTTS